jgi:hypothetical protein
MAPSTTEPSAGDRLARALFSDRLRGLKIAALTALLLAGGWHLSWSLDREIVDISEMLADPEAHVGHPVMLGNFKVVSIDGDQVELWSPWTLAVAYPRPDELKLGDAISLRGTFQADQRIRADEWSIHDLLWIKKIIGLSGMALALGLVAWELVALRRARA